MKGIAEHLTAFTPNTRIADCLECHSSTLQENQIKKEGVYKVYGANGICGYNDSPAITNDAILIVKDGSGVGNVSFVTGEYSVIGTSNYLTAKFGYSLKYLYYCLMIFKFDTYKTGILIWREKNLLLRNVKLRESRKACFSHPVHWDHTLHFIDIHSW